MNENKELEELFSIYPSFSKEWITYSFLRWCHPLGRLAWKPGLEKAREQHPDWVQWLERDCLKFLLETDEDFKDFIKNELENFLNKSRIKL